METKEKFIQVFTEISDLASKDNGQTPEEKSQDTLTAIIYGLEALSEFSTNCDSETPYTLQTIRKQFDPKDRTGKKVNNFLDVVNTIVFHSNRYGLEFGKIAEALTQFKDE